MSTVTPTFSTRPDLDMILSTLPDIFRCWSTTEFKMTITETGSGNNYFERNELATRFKRLPLHLRPCWIRLQHFRQCPALFLLQEFKMATNKPKVEITLERYRCSAIPASTPMFSVIPDSGHTVDIVRRRPTTENQYDGHRNRKWWPPS
jgi:hypothetical protein